MYNLTKYIIQCTVCKKNNVKVKSTHFLDLSTITANRLALYYIILYYNNKDYKDNYIKIEYYTLLLPLLKYMLLQSILIL